MSNSFN